MTLNDLELADKIAKANQYKNDMVELAELRHQNNQMKQILIEVYNYSSKCDKSELENGSTMKYFIDRALELHRGVLFAKKRIEYFLKSNNIEINE